MVKLLVRHVTPRWQQSGIVPEQQMGNYQNITIAQYFSIAMAQENIGIPQTRILWRFGMQHEESRRRGLIPVLEQCQTSV